MTNDGLSGHQGALISFYCYMGRASAGAFTDFLCSYEEDTWSLRNRAQTT